MRPDMIQSVIRAPYKPVVCPSELLYMLLGCLDELFQLFRFIAGATELPALLCLYLRGRGQAWRTRVLAAEARKAGSASEAARRIPSPPSFTGKEARDH